MQIQSKKYLLGPGERIINNYKIIRIDLNVLNRNQKKISGFLFHSPDLNA
jgi:hypothetical protein